MTLASDIILRAYREGNLSPLALAAPSANQQNEALPLLNEQLLGALGSEVGNDLGELNIGGPYDETAYCSQWVPMNARLVLNLTAALTLKLHPQPYDGQRLAFVDAANNLATYPLTLNGNGRLIEGTSTLLLNTNGANRQWFYRADTGTWTKVSALALTDTIPFPEEFDSFFTTRLAIRLFPRYMQTISAETAKELERVEGLIEARYRKPRPAQELGTLGLIGQRRGAFGLSQADFAAGRTFRW